MIFKVLYQESAVEVPVRERTSTIYLEADSEKDVRKKLAPFNYNIELIQGMSDAHLEREESSPDFVLRELD